MKKSIQSVMLASVIACSGGSNANAQCLLDIFGLGKSSSASAKTPTAVPGYPYAANYPVVPAGYPLPMQTVGSGMPYSAGYAGIPQSAVSLAAPTNYDTSYFKVPTTYYRPVTTTDPRTGQQVTTMMPCTSYQMQALRSPAWSLGQWVHGGNQTPMVPAAALPAATSSPGMMSPVNNSSTVSGMVPNAADPNSIPTLPAINPTLPVYGTQVQSSYGNPSAALNTQPMLGGYNNGVVSANYMPSTIPNGYSNTSPGQNNSNLYGAASGVYPSDWNTPTTSPSSVTGSGTISNSTGVYPSLPTDPQYPATPMYSADPPPAGVPTTHDPAATEKPIFPPAESTSGGYPQQNSSRSESEENQGRIQSVVRQPSGDMREMSSRSIERVTRPSTKEDIQKLPQNVGAEPKSVGGDVKGTVGPALKPIPLPDGFDTEPQWNPSLLNSSDKTAARPSLERVPRQSLSTGHTTDDVRWASYSDNAGKSMAASELKSVESGRRPASTSVMSETRSRYDASGWKSAN